MSGLDTAATFLRLFVPPDLSVHYLVALAGPALESLGMTAGAILIAYAASLPLGLYIGLRGPGTRVIQAVLSGIRAVPDLTLAIFCVIVVGVGAGAGMIAMAIFYTAAIGKIFGDLFRTADNGPLEALRSTGASPTQVGLFGLLPLKFRDLLTYGSYEFESAVRASVIVGAVGGGGLGTELVGTLNAFDFQRTTTIILVLIAMVAAIDQLTVRLRRHPAWMLAFFPPAAYALWHFLPQHAVLAHAARTIAGMFPPELDGAAWARLPHLVAETAQMAVLGTALAVVFALPLGILSARNITPWFLASPVRRGLEALRAIPEVVWGLILVTIAGVGPAAGTFALGLHSAGSLGRLFAESLENVRPGPVLAIASTGASPLAVASYGTIPLSLGALGVHTLFRLEWNLRQATVVGMIGAGGIGQALFEAQQLFFYRQMIAYLLITWTIVLLVDRLSAWTRGQFGGIQLAPEETVR
jgi:phosphonate transport system permease protein